MPTTMNDDTRNDQTIWEERWRGTVWERFGGAGWLLVADHAQESLAILSAWNPAGQRLPIAVNQARDAVLFAELIAMGLSPVRARGRSPDHAWSEEGWQIPHLPTRTEALLRRYGQLAGWIMGPTGAQYAWAEPPPAR